MSINYPTLSDVLVEINKYSGCSCCRKGGKEYLQILRAHINAKRILAYRKGWEDALKCAQLDLNSLVKMMGGARDLSSEQRRAVIFLIVSCINTGGLRLKNLSIADVTRALKKVQQESDRGA